jgi:hypothetical protein
MEWWQPLDGFESSRGAMSLGYFTPDHPFACLAEITRRSISPAWH